MPPEFREQVSAAALQPPNKSRLSTYYDDDTKLSKLQREQASKQAELELRLTLADTSLEKAIESDGVLKVESDDLLEGLAAAEEHQPAVAQSQADMAPDIEEFKRFSGVDALKPYAAAEFAAVNNRLGAGFKNTTAAFGTVNKTLDDGFCGATVELGAVTNTLTNVLERFDSHDESVKAGFGRMNRTMTGTTTVSTTRHTEVQQSMKIHGDKMDAGFGELKTQGDTQTKVLEKQVSGLARDMNTHGRAIDAGGRKLAEGMRSLQASNDIHAQRIRQTGQLLMGQGLRANKDFGRVKQRVAAVHEEVKKGNQNMGVLRPAINRTTQRVQPSEDERFSLQDQQNRSAEENKQLNAKHAALPVQFAQLMKDRDQAAKEVVDLSEQRDQAAKKAANLNEQMLAISREYQGLAKEVAAGTDRREIYEMTVCDLGASIRDRRSTDKGLHTLGMLVYNNSQHGIKEIKDDTNKWWGRVCDAVEKSTDTIVQEQQTERNELRKDVTALATKDDITELLSNLTSQLANIGTKDDFSAALGALPKAASPGELKNLGTDIMGHLAKLGTKDEFSAALSTLPKAASAGDVQNALSSLPKAATVQEVRDLLAAAPTAATTDDIRGLLSALPTPLSAGQIETLLAGRAASVSQDLEKMQASITGHTDRALSALPKAASSEDVGQLTRTLATGLAGVASKEDLEAVRSALPKRSHEELGDDEESPGRRQRPRTEGPRSHEAVQPRLLSVGTYGDLLQVKAVTSGGTLGFAELSVELQDALLAWVNGLCSDWYASGLRRSKSCVGNPQKGACKTVPGQPDVACDRCVGATRFCMRRHGQGIAIFPLHSTDRTAGVEKDSVAFWKLAKATARKSKKLYNP